MSDDPTHTPDPDPLSDASIRSIVEMVEKAEILAGELSVSVSRAMEVLLRSARVSSRHAAGEQDRTLAALKNAATRPQ